MGVRVLKRGCKGEDVRVIQNALNRHGAGLVPDGDFGGLTRTAVIAFQEQQRKRNPRFGVDGEVGRQTRSALFPLVGVTVTVYGMRLRNPTDRLSTPQRFMQPPSLVPPLTLNPPTPIPPPPPPLNLNLPLPGLFSPTVQKIPGLLEPIAVPSIITPSATTRGPEWQQFAQTQATFPGLFNGPAVNSFAIGIQSVFNKSDDDNHVEFTTGCLLQSPIGFQDSRGNAFTLGCFANATWVDPLLHFGMVHLANPYAQVQFQGNASGPALPTLQVGAIPVNINVDLNDDGLQFNFSGGAIWNLGFQDNGISSTFGGQLGFGLLGRFRAF